MSEWCQTTRWVVSVGVGCGLVVGVGACEKNGGETREAGGSVEREASAPSGSDTGASESGSAGDVGGRAQGSGEPDLAEATDEQKKLLAKAKASFLKDDFGAAEPIFEEVTETGPPSGTQMSAYIALGQIYLERGEPREAIDLLELAPEAGDEVVEMRLVLARAYADDEEFAEAIDEYEKLLELQPNYLFVYPPLGSIYVRQGQKKKAAKLYHRYENRLETMATTLEQSDDSKAIERLNVLDIFASSNDARVVQAIEAALDDPKPRVRAKAAKTAGAVKAVTAQSKLEEMAEGDSNEYVRRQAERAAAQLEKVEAPPERDGPRENFE